MKRSKNPIVCESLTLPEHWASALINDDWTGLEPSERDDVKRWLKYNPHLSIVDCADDPDLMIFDGLLTQCLTYQAHVNFTRVSDNGIEYLIYPAEPFYKPLAWQSKGLQQTASGYGAKLTTSNCICVNGRVYRIYSNVGSTWINFKGRKVFLS